MTKSSRGPSETPDSPDVIARVRGGATLVETIARQVRRQVTLQISEDELKSYGNEGLLTAARSFDPTRGVPFAAWAALRVRGAMIDGVRSIGRLPRKIYAKLRALEAANATEDALVEEDAAKPIASPEDADARLDAYMASIATAMALGFVAAPRDDDAEDTDTPEALLAANETAAALRAAVSRLPEIERTLVERHYFGDVTIDEAAREVGLSKSWGSRIHARAVEMIARDLKRNRALP